MGKLKCFCNYIIEDNIAPNDNKYDLFKDHFFYLLGDKLDKLTMAIEHSLDRESLYLRLKDFGDMEYLNKDDLPGSVINYLENFYLTSRQEVFKCPNCNRLLLMDKDQVVESYIKE